MSCAVSVVLPVFNGAATIGRAIASIRAQTLRDRELLVVDDGSTDATREIVGAIAREDARVPLSARRREGVVAALIRGSRAGQLACGDVDSRALACCEAGI